MPQDKDQIVFNRTDNWGFFTYNQSRVLDALSCLFHFSSPCCASVLYDKKLYLSYNSHIPNSNKATSLQTNFVIKTLNSKHAIESLLSIYLVLNADYIDFIKNQARHESPKDDLFNSLRSFIQHHKVLKTKILQDLQQKPEIALNDYHEIIRCYLKILADTKSVSEKKSEEIIGQLLRPLQDCIKIKYSMDGGSVLITEAIILDNKDNIHAEYNIIQHFQLKHLLKNDAGSTYIGTSKLCCAYCHQYLQDQEYTHRGTHGIADQKWKMYLESPQFNKFQENLLKDAIDLEQGQERLQYRSLSTDTLYESASLKILGDKTFSEFKSEFWSNITAADDTLLNSNDIDHNMRAATNDTINNHHDDYTVLSVSVDIQVNITGDITGNM